MQFASWLTKDSASQIGWLVGGGGELFAEFSLGIYCTDISILDIMRVEAEKVISALNHTLTSAHW